MKKMNKCNILLKCAKEKYRGVFEIQKSGDKTSSGEIGLDIRTHASPKVGQDQVSGGVSVLCWHAAPVAYSLLKKSTIVLLLSGTLFNPSQQRWKGYSHTAVRV